MEYSSQDLDFALEAIDKISSHKNRPNLPRIARYLYRVHDFSSHKTIKILEHLLAENRVKEVVYKGNISYRNILKWKWRRSSSGGEGRADAEMNCFVLKTLKVLFSSNPGLAKTGLSDKQLERAMLITNPSLTVEEVKKLILTELEVETVQRNANGLLVAAYDGDLSSAHNSSEEMSDGSETIKDDPPPPPPPPPQESPAPKKTSPGTSAHPRKHKDRSPPQAVRKGDRIIRKRTRYDPSEFFCPPLVKRNKRTQDAMVVVKPVEKRGPKKSMKRKKIVGKPKEGGAVAIRSGVQQGGPLLIDSQKTMAAAKETKPADEKAATADVVRSCFLCRKRADTFSNKIVPCVTCHRVGHDLCIKKEEDVRPGTLKWMCVMCRSIRHSLCIKCHSPDHKLGRRWSVTCDSCQSLYHNDCHRPPLSPPAPRIWVCHHCTNRENMSNSLIGCGPEVSSTHGTSSFSSHSGTECLLSDPLSKPVYASSKTKDSEDYAEIFPDPKSKEHKKAETKRPEPKAVIKLETDKAKDDKKDKAVDKSEKKMEKNGKSIEAIDKPVETIVKLSQKSLVEKRKDRVSLEKSEKSIDRWILSGGQNTEMEVDNSDKVNEVHNPRLYKPADSIPDVSEWTIKDVCDYFKNQLGDNVANAFLNQEVDGAGLKVMSREDVTDRLGLTLGAALKTLYIIRKIQRNTCDLVSLWAN